MRSIAFALAALALFSLGATSSTSCLSSLLPLLGNGITVPLTVSIHVINDAYSPVSASLIVDEPKSGITTTLAAADSTTDAPATQPAGGSTVDKGQDIKLATLPCAAIAAPISLEAKMEGTGDASTSATSPKLFYDDDFSCGDRVNFIIRPAAMVGFVVGYEVIEGGAD